ncbi:uncharacterized protein DNG_04899 [Cephalotrichum gorgonifer]|uniref:Uncharacterized protein n=1 Tax=Cephalotrichum gorgonifer TaxID=2041049 RepID=A0AAE8MWX3_9PEZI|nr:uncharacterized protein DNG_04899 [Cephalotrichum gorgonifer]
MCFAELTICEDCSRVHRVSLAYCEEAVKATNVDGDPRPFDVVNFCWSPLEGCTGLEFPSPVLSEGRCESEASINGNGVVNGTGSGIAHGLGGGGGSEMADSADGGDEAGGSEEDGDDEVGDEDEDPTLVPGTMALSI